MESSSEINLVFKALYDLSKPEIILLTVSASLNLSNSQARPKLITLVKYSCKDCPGLCVMVKNSFLIIVKFFFGLKCCLNLVTISVTSFSRHVK